MKTLAAVLALFLITLSVADAGTLATITVRPDAEVAAKSAVLADIASVRSSNKTLAAQIRQAELCPAPSPGRSRTISRDDIVIALRRAGIDDRTVDLFCPQKVSIIRSFRRVTGQAVFEAARDYASKANSWQGTIDIQPAHLLPDLEVPTGKFELRVKPGLRSVRKGQNSLSVEIVIDDQIYRTLTCSIVIRELAPVLVATRSIQRSGAINLSSVKTEQRDITLMPDDTIIGEPAPGLIASVPIGEGSVIRKSWLSETPVVRSGDDVSVIVESGAIRVADRGTAAQDGSVGQVIRVKLGNSARDIRATVSGPGSVKICVERD